MPTPFHEQELCTGITIRNNLIEEVTNEDWGGVGIGAGYVKNIHIVHNEVCTSIIQVSVWAGDGPCRKAE